MLRAALALCLLVFLGFFLGACGSFKEAPPEPAAPAPATSESAAVVPDGKAATQQPQEPAPGEGEQAKPQEAGAMTEQAGTPAPAMEGKIPAGGQEPQAAMAGEKGPAMAAMTPQTGQTAAEPRMERSPEPPPQDKRIPFEKAFPEEARKIRPVRIAVLSSPNRPQAGQQVALILGTYQRPRLERILGRKVKIAFVSQSSKPHKAQTVILYRPDFLKAAIQAASVMPGAQVVEPMTEPELSREGTDIIIYVGEDTR